MVEVEINGEKRCLTDRYETWVSQRMRKLRLQGQEIWVRIHVGGDLNFLLPIGPCPAMGVGSGELSPRQENLCNFFRRSGIKDRPIQPGTIISFLKDLKRFLRGL